MFGKFGAIGRVVIPPSHTIAIVEFLEGPDAKTAFRSLAYRKFKMEPLYLEVRGRIS
jgi:multiple RNA-binding domain-containing protein 1